MTTTKLTELQLDSSFAKTTVPIDSQSSGFVTEVGEGAFYVAHQNGRLKCLRAVGCLIEPKVGDLVMLFREDHEVSWIISVLVRKESDQACVMSLPSNTMICAEKMGFTTSTFTIDSASVQVNSDDTQFVGKLFFITAVTFKAVGQTFSAVADRITQYSHTYFRTTTGMDKTEAKQCEIRAKQMLRLKGDYALIEGDSLVKAKGSQIHFG
jgi:Protein of unknown function (DUF3540)